MENASNVTHSSTTVSKQTSTSTLLIIQILCYSAIIAVGTFGNILIFVSIGTKTKRKISDYFILNLTITDLLCCVVSIPFDIMELVLGYWPLGLLMCKIVYPLQTVLMAVSVVTLLFMALERHRAIIYPLKPKIRGRYVILTIIILWITAFALVTPYINTLGLHGSHCIENWPGKSHAKAFTLCVFVLLYVTPLSIILAVFIRVALRLRNSNYTITRAFGNTMIGRQMCEKRSKRNVRVLKIFVSAVVAFAVCFLPFQVMWLWNDFGDAKNHKYLNDIFTFSYIMVYSNSAINPFIFSALSQKFRSFIRRSISRKRTSIQPSYVNRRPSLGAILKSSFHNRRSRTIISMTDICHSHSNEITSP
ncbi:neuropeptide FF receptor 2-like [Exaiptasia diaphana]|uniref:G-protein coupled receptors family 1 profile domain-containing protein n=1 Tax=Exaiptasia diaphana TaxID=2652724 RepID=A0A913X0T7_EXADI|nr:neuropeptide FF receptor 2-like [Exaiptasia diaphana]